MSTPAPEMTLGDRMKAYEKATRTYLPAKSYTVVRMDGRGFSKFTRRMTKPFDMDFLRVMDAVTVELCREVAGVKVAYTQSDEISLILSDLDNENTQPFLGGQVQKLVSITAGLATAYFNHIGPREWFTDGPAVFDSRAFTVGDVMEVGNYLLWRQRDARRNAISMAASSVYSHKELHGKSTGERIEMLAEVGKDVLPSRAEHGAVVWRDVREEKFGDQTFQRHWWRVQEAPNLDASADGWVRETLYRMYDRQALRNQPGAFQNKNYSGITSKAVNR